MNQIYFFRKKVLAKKYFLEKSINKKYPQKVLTKNGVFDKTFSKKFLR